MTGMSRLRMRAFARQGILRHRLVPTNERNGRTPCTDACRAVGWEEINPSDGAISPMHI